jgi:hypothetical protein
MKTEHRVVNSTTRSKPARGDAHDFRLPALTRKSPPVPPVAPPRAATPK